MSKVGRNDPCPCGSGLKYKRCCLGKTDVSLTQDLQDELHETLAEGFEDCNFSTIEEAEAYAAQYIQNYNNALREEFKGLSSTQMKRMLDYPFDSPEIVTFAECLDSPPSAPAIVLLQMLVDAIGDQGLKLTAKGNLPLKFLKDSALACFGDNYLERLNITSLRTEADFLEMHVVCIVALQSGLVRRYKEKIILGQKYHDAMSKHGMAGVYPILLLAYIQDYKWSYPDGFPDVAFFQQSFIYTLYMLSMYGSEWHPSSYYEDAFIEAFPAIYSMVPDVSFRTPEHTVRRCYCLRVLIRFAQFLGLIEIEWTDDKLLDRAFKLKKLPLLDKAIVFHFADI